jgi:hypothetical protein
LRFEGALAETLIQIAFVAIVIAIILVFLVKGSTTRDEILKEATGKDIGPQKPSIISKKVIPKDVSKRDFLNSISELSEYIEQIPFSPVEDWSEKIAEEELDRTLGKIHSLADSFRESYGGIDTPDEVEMALSTVRKRFLQARKDIKTRGDSESEYYRLVANLNRAIIEAKTKGNSDSEQIQFVRNALQNVQSYNTKPYFSMQLQRRAKRAIVEAQDLLPSHS